MCSLQVSFVSICIPKYRTDGESGINMLLKKTGTALLLLRVLIRLNVPCEPG
jgi:hypothetical protein